MPPVIYVPRKLPGIIRCPVDANPPVTSVKWEKDGYPLRVEKVGLPRHRLCHLTYISLNLSYFPWFSRHSSSLSIKLFIAISNLKKDIICLFVVPRLELAARRKHPGGGGHRRLPGHLHLCALQRPGYHGHVPPCHFGAKGTQLPMMGNVFMLQQMDFYPNFCMMDCWLCVYPGSPLL